jgi:hypothetical protein
MTNIVLHPGQSEVYGDLFVDKVCRNAVATCSRGWGKSYFAAVSGFSAVIELLQLDESVPNKNVYIIAPTYSQVTDIYYPLLNYQLEVAQYARRSSKDLGRFWFPKNVELKLVSFEAVERLRGTGAYFVVNDEVEDWQKGLGFQEAWQAIIQPCISTRWSPKRAAIYKAPSPGRSLTIGTPKGYTFFYDMYNTQDIDTDWKSYHFDYTTSPYLDPDEIDRIKHTIDPLRFAREYMASFEDSGNSVFYCFDRKIHIRKDIEDFADEEDVHIGIDFNVGLQCSSAFAIRGNRPHYIDEFKGHPDTENLALAICARYKNNKRKIYVYPDPTGNSRKTSAAVGVTDFSILKDHGLILKARPKSPPIVDSVNAVNAMLKTAAGDVNMYFHPRCTGTIQSLERTRWLENNPDTATLDKSEGLEHFSDSVRYPIEYLYPINKGGRVAKRGFAF